MRIEEGYHEESNAYTKEVKAYVESVLSYAFDQSKLQDVLERIKEQAEKMQALFFTEQEEKERMEQIEEVNQKMEMTADATLHFMTRYQIGGWKELIYDDDEMQGGATGEEE